MAFGQRLHRVRALVLCVPSILIAGQAFATPVTIAFHGTVSEIVSYDAPDALCPGCAVPLGTEVSGSYTFGPSQRASAARAVLSLAR
jgi:hypothetical protein